MPDGHVSPADLAATLEALRLRPASVPTVAAAMQGQLELAFGRLAAVTELLRQETEWNEATRLAARLLLTDLGTISAQFRAEANEAAARLTRVLESISVTPGD